jgi:NADH:ubiquinone oxidoreductase subunit 6 (subunit J)
MRYVFGESVLVAIYLGAVATAPAFAMTCTDRQQVCFAYCVKNYNNAPPCRATCGQLLATCMSTGCWDSKVTARQCGITKQ